MIPTVEEFLKGRPWKNGMNLQERIHESMIQFAKLHVEAALKEASEKATAGQTFVDMGGEFEDIPIYEAYVVKDSILNAYPLENIK